MNEIGTAAQLVRLQLLSFSSVTDIVEDRIYTQHFNDFDNATVNMPLIIVENKGGYANHGKGTQKVELDIYCYSRSGTAECSQIYSAIYDALQSQRLHNPNISMKGYCYEKSRPLEDWSDGVMAWAKRGHFCLHTAG